MKNRYNELIKNIIGELQYDINALVVGINEIASTIEYHSFEEKHDLTKSEIEEINDKRNHIIAIYELISDLDNLKK